MPQETSIHQEQKETFSNCIPFPCYSRITLSDSSVDCPMFQKWAGCQRSTLTFSSSMSSSSLSKVQRFLSQDPKRHPTIAYGQDCASAGAYSGVLWIDDASPEKWMFCSTGQESVEILDSAFLFLFLRAYMHYIISLYMSLFQQFLHSSTYKEPFFSQAYDIHNFLLAPDIGI